MRFQIEQQIAGPVEAVARLYTEPRFYERLGELPKLGRPEVLERREDGSVVHLAVRFRFTGHLSPAVTRMVDPAKLSWVEESVHDLEGHTVTFHMQPDNYADRLRFEGSSRFEADGDDGTRRVAEGDVVVRVPLVGRAVEGAIVSGLREHLAAEVAVVEELLADP
ncbi:MAG TPA: DUF2505 family protein [Acidimicrobiia bacterium]|nr:DUF2505 family protein [Acidimicrobiia bacterium]HKN90312.1 DUF2505 family protein [Acidimicrobiia bacterium]